MPDDEGESDGDNAWPQNVQFPGLQGVEDSIQEIRESVLHNNRGQGLERAYSVVVDAVLCGDT